MLKFLPIGAVVLLIIGILVYTRIQSAQSNQPKNLIQQFTNSNPSSSDSVSQADTNDRLKTLELAVGALIQKVNQLEAGSSTSSASQIKDLNDRVSKLESTVTDLQSRTGTYSQAAIQSLPSSSVTTNSSPVYIPLATNGTSGDQNMVPLPGSGIIIDPASYPGYKNMQLTVNMNLGQSVGAANATLYDVTDNVAISGSQVSTTNSTSTVLLSGKFTLPAGQKTYALGVQSTVGYTIYVQSASVKVNF